jgi:hypothetical protein
MMGYAIGILPIAIKATGVGAEAAMEAVAMGHRGRTLLRERCRSTMTS